MDGLIREDGLSSGVTRAVVVGISDYQHPDIPDLHFAHRDAEAFASYLRATFTDSIEHERIILLLNKEATAARVSNALYSLIEECEQGDKAILYFACHGDLEVPSKTNSYLLCFDASPGNYTIGGTIAFAFFQKWLKRITAKGIHVELYMDACHSGNLAGSAFNGSGKTAKIFHDSFAIETKYLACTPNESSFESYAWGKGHGIFTYSLIRGMTGLADLDGNSVVTRWELKNYIEEEVVNSSGNLQHPLGPIENLEEPITKVDTFLLQKLIQSQQREFTIYPNLKIRSFEHQLLSVLDSTLRNDWLLFRRKIKEKQFLEPQQDCADYYYTRIWQRTNLTAAFKRYATRAYTSALLDDGQQALLAILNANTKYISGGKELIPHYKNYPKLFLRAADILGPKHDMFNTIQSRAYLLKGVLSYIQSASYKDSVSIAVVMNDLNHSLSLEPNSALAHFYISLCQVVQKQQPDSAIVSAQKAHSLAPNWLVPLTHLAYNLSRPPFKRFGDAKALLELAFSINEHDPSSWLALGALYHYLPNSNKAIEAFSKVIELDSTYAMAWTNLGVEYVITHKYNKAQQAFNKAIQLQPNQSNAWHTKGCLNQYIGNLQEAESCYLRALELNKDRVITRDSLATLHYSLGDLKSSKSYCLSILNIQPKYANAHFVLAKIYYSSGEDTKASYHLKQALRINKKYMAIIKEDENLISILKYK